MSTLYVVRQGCILKKLHNNLQLMKGNLMLEMVPVETVDRVVVLGNVTISPSAIQLLLRNGIDTVFLSWTGRYLGRLSPKAGKDVFLRLQQYGRFQDKEYRLSFARVIVESKLKNQLRLLQLRKKRGTSEWLEKGIKMIDNVVKRSTHAENHSVLRGLEGRGGAIYFKCYGKFFLNREFFFKNRNRRPPMDPVNVLLSLGYTLLVAEIHKEVESAGLDPAVGFYHELSYGRPSIVLDLEEEFRTIAVDMLVLNSCNRRIMRLSDFYFSNQVAEDAKRFPEYGFSTRESPVVLTYEGYRKFIELFERRLNTRVYETGTGKRIEIGKIIKRQVSRIIRSIKGEEQYEPFQWDLEKNRT